MGLNPMVILDVDDHGSWQLPRAAMRPTCDPRHARAAAEPDASSSRIPEARTGSADPTLAGSNTNARSFLNPSPLMSLDTPGVNGRPDLKEPESPTGTQSKKLYEIPYVT